MLSKCASPTSSSAGVKGKGSGSKGSPMTPATRGSLTPMSARARDLDTFPTPIPFRRQSARVFDEESELSDAASMSLVPFDPTDTDPDPELAGALVPVDNMEPNGTGNTGDDTGNGLFLPSDGDTEPFSDASIGSVDLKWEQEVFFRDDSGSDSDLSVSTRRKMREAWIHRDYVHATDIHGTHISVAKRPVSWAEYLDRNMEEHGWTKFGGTWQKTGPTYRAWGQPENPTPQSPTSMPMSSKGPGGGKAKPQKDGSAAGTSKQVKNLSKMVSPKRSPMKVLKKPSCKVSPKVTPPKKKVIAVEDSPKAPALKRTKRAPKTALSPASTPMKKSGGKQ